MGLERTDDNFHFQRAFESISPKMCKALPFFHAYTGCDTVSAFHGIGKAKAWIIWKNLQESMTEVFNRLTSATAIVEEDFKKIQLFTVLMYDLTSQAQTVNECSRILYIQKNRCVENTSPSEQALRQHLK